MAACALRGIRYIAFPAVVFEAPESVFPEDGPPEAALPETVSAPVEAPVPGPPVMMALPPALPALPAQPVSAQPVSARPVSARPVLAQMQAPALEIPVPETPVPETPVPEIPVPAIPVPAFAPPQPDDAPPRLRRLAELSAAATLTRPQDAAPARRFALLNDIAVELRPRRARARTGRA